MKEKFANEPLIIPGAAAVVFVVGTLVIWVFTRERKTVSIRRLKISVLD